jgi:hypothetical protein
MHAFCSGETWFESSDHSKWAISIFPRLAHVCVGDINKQRSQANRGGGTYCMQSAPLHRAFSALLVKDASVNEPYTPASGVDANYPSVVVPPSQTPTSPISPPTSEGSSAAVAYAVAGVVLVAVTGVAIFYRHHVQALFGKWFHCCVSTTPYAKQGATLNFEMQVRCSVWYHVVTDVGVCFEIASNTSSLTRTIRYVLRVRHQPVSLSGRQCQPRRHSNLILRQNDRAPCLICIN